MIKKKKNNKCFAIKNKQHLNSYPFIILIQFYFHLFLPSFIRV